MRYMVEFPPNRNMVIVHVDKQVSKKLEMFLDRDSAEKEGTPGLARNLLGIDGITGVSLDVYDVRVTKGCVFTWAELMGAIHQLVHLSLDPGGPYIDVSHFSLDSKVPLAESQLAA